MEDEDLVASSQNIIESYVEDSSSINTKIDEQLKSIEALLEEKKKNVFFKNIFFNKKNYITVITRHALNLFDLFLVISTLYYNDIFSKPFTTSALLLFL